jgi:uncharacterized protein YbaP (TraB family)
MFRKLFLPLLSLFTLGSSAVGLTSASCSPPEKPAGNPNSLLWEISGNGLKQKSYLFGTIHLIKKEDFFFPAVFEKTLRKTDKLVMEINLGDMLGQLNAMTKMTMDSNRTLEDLYTEEEYAFIKKTAKDSLDVNIGQFESMKPIFVQQSLITSSIFGEETKSYELHLMTLALKNGIGLDGLETAAEQMSILDSISLEDQADMLLESLQNLHATRHSLDDMVKQYKAQNLDSLYALFEKEENMDEFQGSLLDNRNKKWIPLIENFIAQQPCFIAVGAGHLGGKNGVINLLRERGYTLTPVH